MTAYSEKDKANLFYAHYAAIYGTALARGNSSFKEQILFAITKSFTPGFLLANLPAPPRLTTITELIVIIKKLTTRYAPGIDTLSNALIKNMFVKTITLLSNLLNSMLKLHHFHTPWKTALVIPILKPGETPSTPDSYRPISLLSSLAKIAERIILKRLLEISLELNVIPRQRFGFRPKHATTHQLTKVIEHVKTSSYEGLSTVLVLLDS